MKSWTYCCNYETVSHRTPCCHYVRMIRKNLVKYISSSEAAVTLCLRWFSDYLSTDAQQKLEWE